VCGVAARIQPQEVKRDFFLSQDFSHFRAAPAMLAMLAPRAHHELRFLRRVHNRRVVPSPYGIFHNL